MQGYFGGGAQEARKSTNVVNFRYFGEQVFALIVGLVFLPCDTPGGEVNFEKSCNTLFFVRRNACARQARRAGFSRRTSTNNKKKILNQTPDHARRRE